MKNFELIEDYFIKLHRNYGISEVSYYDQMVLLDDNNMKKLVFMFEAFNQEFDNLIHHCDLIYNELEKGFSLKIRKDINNNYLVNIL